MVRQLVGVKIQSLQLLQGRQFPRNGPRQLVGIKINCCNSFKADSSRGMVPVNWLVKIQYLQLLQGRQFPRNGSIQLVVSEDPILQLLQGRQFPRNGPRQLLE